MVFEISDIISLIEIGVNILLALLIGYFIQRNQINSRTLKDYYIQEIAKLHDEIIQYLNTLDSSSIEPQIVTSWFRTRGAKANNLGEAIEKRYKVSCATLIQDLITLQGEVENDPNFSANYLTNTPTRLTNLTNININDYTGNNAKIFHELIGKVNDYSKIFGR